MYGFREQCRSQVSSEFWTLVVTVVFYCKFKKRAITIRFQAVAIDGARSDFENFLIRFNEFDES